MDHSFTPREKKVLQGLVENPTLNDRELSEVIGISPSTITAIRRRLRKGGVFRTVRVPMGNRLGYEILAIGYGNLPSSLKERHRQAFRDWVKKIPYIFLSIESSDSMLNMAYLKNYTMFREYSDAMSEVFKDCDLIDHKTWSVAIFSLGACKLLSFINYAPAVRRAFGQRERVKVDTNFEKLSCQRLTAKERAVLKGLVQCPESTSKEIAKTIGVSRQTVSAMKKRFENAGMLITVRIVDLERLGYRILALAHSRFTPKASITARREGIRHVLKKVPSVLNIASNPENVLIAPAMDFDEYHMLKSEVLRLYGRKGFLREEPTMILIPFSDMRIIKEFDFSAFVEVIASEGG